MSRKHGFTLIELLVVISIVALLVAILLPALGRARDVARTVQCLSAQRQVYTGAAVFAVDNQGFAPGSGYTFWGWGAASSQGLGMGGWYNRSTGPGAEPANDATLVARGYIMSREIFSCPIMQDPGLLSALYPQQWPGWDTTYGYTYGYNPFIIGGRRHQESTSNPDLPYNDAAVFHIGQFYTGQAARLTDIPRASRVIFSGDNLGTAFDQLGPTTVELPGSSITAANVNGWLFASFEVMANHDNLSTAAVVYADGHGVIERPQMINYYSPRRGLVASDFKPFEGM